MLHAFLAVALHGGWVKWSKLCDDQAVCWTFEETVADALGALSLEKKRPVGLPFEQEAGCAPEQGWGPWRREKNLAPVGNRTRCLCRPVRNIFTITTILFRIVNSQNARNRLPNDFYVISLASKIFFLLLFVVKSCYIHRLRVHKFSKNVGAPYNSRLQVGDIKQFPH